MRIIFMGTPDFSVGTLEALVEAGHEVCLVVSQPDKPKGRGKEMQSTPVKEAAMKHGIPVYQPKKIRDPECVEELRKYNADVMVVIAMYMPHFFQNTVVPRQSSGLSSMARK